jgi:hypothetical protein
MRLLVVLLIMALIVPVALAGGTPGQDQDPNLSGTPISKITHTTPSDEGNLWSITITLNDDAVSNNTSVEALTQICYNLGSCLSPKPLQLSSDDGKIWSGEVIAKGPDSCSEADPNDCLHTYVNWKVTLDYSDDETEEEFPDNGYYKTWSSCWFDTGTWGGNNCIQIDLVDKEEDSLDSVPMVSVMFVMLVAALIRRQ